MPAGEPGAPFVPITPVHGQEVGDEQRADQVADQHDREVQAERAEADAALDIAIGTSAMLPVSSSEPASTTSTRPSANTEPANSVGSVPHVSGLSPR